MDTLWRYRTETAWIRQAADRKASEFRPIRCVDSLDRVVGFGERKENMNDKTNTENRFLEEGIKRYEEARDTIIALEREMETLLDEVVANRQNWKPLKRKDTKPASASTSIQFGYWI